MSATRRITVKIAGKEYAMTIPQSEEEKYRRAAAEINQMISNYRGSYVAEDEEYLAMAALQMGLHKVNLEMDRNLNNEMLALEEIENRIDNYLSKVNE